MKYIIKAHSNPGQSYIEIDKNILNISKTLDCGQCFRWKHLGYNPKSDIEIFKGVVGDKAWILGQTNIRSLVLDEEDTKSILYINKSIEEAQEILDYLDLYTDYSNLKIPENDKFAQAAQHYGLGIRILNQDPWETTVSFIVSQRNNIPKIKSSIDKLCTKFGTPITEDNKIEAYEFPSAEQIVAAGVDGLNSCGLGYRSQYIYDLALRYKNREDFDRYFKHNINDSDIIYNKLLEIRGVGPKVANCISLFGYHCLDRFPIDIWMERIIHRYYNGSIDPSTYGELAGLMQQYMFYYTIDRK